MLISLIFALNSKSKEKRRVFNGFPPWEWLLSVSLSQRSSSLAVALERTESADPALDRAFRLAFYIHQDKHTALQIAAAAMMRLETTTAAQDKRLYYTPTGRQLSDCLKSDGFRNKVTLDSLDLLQLLVFIESEPFERHREAGHDSRELAEEDMIIHFIKHLVTLTMKRNSFYVALGMCRLLYNYSTSETMDIYTVVLQDPDRTKDDHYYRSRKGRLMQELKQRFGELLSVGRGPHGEERFRCLEYPDRYADLVRDCLNLFSPWRNFCPVPAAFDPTRDLLTCLSSHGRLLDEDHRAEVNRIHAILHPDCFNRLTRALALDSPENRLALPHFSLSSGNGDRNGSGSVSGNRNRGNGNDDGSGRGIGPNRRTPPELEEGDRSRIRGYLDDQAARRRAINGRMFSIRIDGKEQAFVNLDRSRSIRLEVDRNATMIEVVGVDNQGEILIATHLLNIEAFSKRAVFSSDLGDGRVVSFYFEAAHDSDACSTVELAFEGPFVQPGSSPRLSLLRHWKSSSLRNRTFALRPILAVSTLLIAVSAGLLYAYLRKAPGNGASITIANNSGASQQLTDQARAGISEFDRPGTSSDSDTSGQSGTPPRINGTAPKSVGSSEAGTRRNNARAGSLADSGATRDPQTGFAHTALADVRLIYLDCRGEAQASSDLRDSLASEIKTSTRFRPADVDNADAALKVSVTVIGEDKGAGVARLPQNLRIRVQLVNAAGDVVWQETKTSAHENLSMKAVAAELFGDLERHARRLESVRK